MFAIFKRELKAYFTSPMAYIFIAVFFFYTAVNFTNYNLIYQNADMTPVFSSAFLIIMITIPLLTMRLFTEEKRHLTDQCLLTAPINLFSIVFGKFLSALCVFLGAMTAYGFYALALVILSGGNVAWPQIIGNTAALILLGASLISLGTFISSLTESQVVAAIVTFISIMAFYLVDMLAGSVNNAVMQRIMLEIGFYAKYEEITTGLFNLKSIIFFLSATFIFNFLTVRTLERRRWGD